MANTENHAYVMNASELHQLERKRVKQDKKKMMSFLNKLNNDIMELTKRNR